VVAMTNEQAEYVLNQIERIVTDSTCECDACLDILELLEAARLNQGRIEIRMARAAGKIS